MAMSCSSPAWRYRCSAATGSSSGCERPSGRTSFDVHYQPIVGWRPARWRRARRSCAGSTALAAASIPHSFIPIAEEMGVIVAVGSIGPAAGMPRRAAMGVDGATAPAVHVNLSPVELRDPHFLAGVAAALEQSGLRPDRLVLEITEGVVLREPEKSIAILEPAAQSRSAAGARRLRHRLLVTEPSALAADRLAEDRQAVHRRDRAGRRSTGRSSG